MDARWICAKEFAELEPINVYGKEHGPKEKPDRTMCNKHIWFKREFEYTGGKYTIDISADDYYKLYINGQFVGMGPSPAYYFCYNYNTFDITPFLKEGKNELRAHTLYQGLCNRYMNSGELREGFWCRIFKDGEIVLASDESFEYAYDQRFLPEAHWVGYETNWTEFIDPSKSALDWQPAVFKKYDDYKMVKQKSEVCQMWDYDDFTVTKLGENDWLFDMKKELSAYTIIEGHEQCAGILGLYYAEELDDDGHARYNMRCMSKNYDLWFPNGKDDIESYEWRCFRYLEIKGNIDPTKVKFKQRGYPYKQIKQIETDIPELKQIYDMCVNTILACSHEIFMDCATRERAQYMGDMRHSGSAFCMLTGDLTPYKKGILDIFTSDFICPGLMAVVPGCFMQEIADSSLVFPRTIHEYAEITGDLSFIKEIMPKLLNMIDYFKKFERPDGLLEYVNEKWNLVSWPENMRDNYDFPLTRPIGPGCHNVINALYYICLMYTEKLCELIGEPRDLGKARLAESFNKVFFDEEQQLYVDAEGSKHPSVFSNLYPAMYDMCEPEHKEKLIDFVYNKFVGGELNIGMGLTNSLIEIFIKNDRIKEAFDIILSTGHHSWINMIKDGATTVYEAWNRDEKWNTSLCHPFGTGPLYIILKYFDGKVYAKDIGR